jgi:hypothetical protein
MEELEDIWKVGGPRSAVREARRLRATQDKGKGGNAAESESFSDAFDEKMGNVSVVERS